MCHSQGTQWKLLDENKDRGYRKWQPDEWFRSGHSKQYSSVYFRRKNKKQIDKDLDRSSKHHQNNDEPNPGKEYALRSASI